MADTAETTHAAPHRRSFASFHTSFLAVIIPSHDDTTLPEELDGFIANSTSLSALNCIAWYFHLGNTRVIIETKAYEISD